MSSNTGADIFLILLRPTRVPVVGEAVSHLFQGQVLIESLSWNLHNEEERKNAEGREDAYNKTKSLVDKRGSLEIRKRHAIQDSERDRNRAFQEYIRERDAADDTSSRQALDRQYKVRRKELADAHQSAMDAVKGIEKAATADDIESAQRDAEIEDADRNRNFEFTFTKSVDIATTQMLNSMKAGDVFPSGTLTIHKRSATVMDGTSLVFTIQKIRLLDYQLQVVVTDTMTEMVEEWTCEFGSLAYVYKNPPSHYSHGNAVQAGIKTITQGTVRAFTMKNTGSPI
jgi:type VI protein secretion system component Hcp